MHILFVHRAFPNQFSHIAHYLANRLGFQCTFACEQLPRWLLEKVPPNVPKPTSYLLDNMRIIPYQSQSGASDQTHQCSRRFEDGIWRCHAVYETLKAFPDVKPDLIVGHSGL